MSFGLSNLHNNKIISRQSHVVTNSFVLFCLREFHILTRFISRQSNVITNLFVLFCLREFHIVTPHLV
jgi:hypothetical protein